MPISKNRFQIKLDGNVYTDPSNWINFTPRTERHKIYRTLLTTFSEGRVKLIKTAKNYVDAAYDLNGVTATINVEWLEYDYDTDSYITIFSLGRLNLSEKYKRSRDFTEVGFEPTSFIMNILNRDEIETSLQSLTDMDGDAITAFADETHNVTVSDQIIDFSASFEHTGLPFINYSSGASVSTLYCQVPLFTKDIINEGVIDVLNSNLPFDAPTFLTTDTPENQIVFLETGDVLMTFNFNTAGDIRTQMAQVDGWILNTSVVIGIYYKINDGIEQLITSATYNATSPNSNPVIKDLTISTLSLVGINKGDAFKMYVKVSPMIGAKPPQILVSVIALTKIVQTTTFKDTNCEFMFPWELFLRLCQKITGRNDCLRSTLFGRTDGEVHTYPSDGDAALFAITTPKLMRGFPLASNPINADLMSIFKGFDSLFLLGLGVVYESGVPYISIERLEHFMDGSSSVTTFIAAYPGIDWVSATNYLWGNVKGGYSKYKLERNPTISSPHSQRTYILPFLSDLISKTYKSVCPFIASGHLIEIIRRERYDDSTKKDGKYDDDLIVLNLKRNGGSFNRVLGDDFNIIQNIDNPTTNSNLHITPARNLLRQAPLLLTGLAKRILTALATSANITSVIEGPGIVTVLIVDDNSAFSIGDFIKFTTNGGVYINTIAEITGITGLDTIVTNYSYNGPDGAGTVSLFFNELLRFQSGDGNIEAGTRTISIGDMLVPEGEDLTIEMAEEVFKGVPLFDASELGKCTVTINKAQRLLIKEGLINQITIIDGDSTYTGFIESIKEVNLEKGVAELKFLSNTNI